MKNVSAVYPLSPMQELMLIHLTTAPESSVLCERVEYTLRGPLDVQAFKRAWQLVLDRHAILRTAFLFENLKRPLQVVRRDVALPWRQYDWRGLPPDQRQQRIEEVFRTTGTSTFDPTQAPLMRLVLAQTEPNVHRFMLNVHHILVDRWSLMLILRESHTFYEAYRRGDEPVAPPPHPYRDYITWLQQRAPAEAEAYWRRTFSTVTSATRLSKKATVPRTASRDSGYGHVWVRLDPSVTASLTAFAKSNRLTLNTLVQGAWALLLNRYSGKTDVVFGITVAGRPADLDGVESIVGLFTNNLPVRAKFHGDRSLVSWLRELQDQQAELQQYDYTPLGQIRQWSNLRPGEELFESLVVFENEASGVTAAIQGSELEIVGVAGTPKTQFPLTLWAAPGKELALGIGYKHSCFDKETAVGVMDELQSILVTMMSSNQLPLAELVGNGSPHSGESESRIPSRPENTSSRQRMTVPPRDRLESQLCGIWERILGGGPVGVTDDFFDLGGNSIKAVEMYVAVEKLVGQRPPLSILIESPTIRHFADSMRESPELLLSSALFALQPLGSLPPLFGIAPANAGASFHELAAALGMNQPFYALQLDCFEGTVSESMSDVATACLREIRVVQPAGPYHLLGLWAGGLIAYEMAQQLRREGHTVGLLGLIDTLLPRRAGIGAMQTTRTANSSASLGWVGMNLVRRLLTRRTNVGGARHGYNANIITEYMPTPYPGPLTLFRSRHSLGVRECASDLGWGQLAENDLDIHRIAGHGESSLRRPFASNMGEKLCACLATHSLDPSQQSRLLPE